MGNVEHILIIGTVFPEPNSSAAGSRILQLIDVFQKQNWKITFASAATDSDFMFDLSTLGIDKVNIELNNSTFDLFIKNLNPSMVIFDRFMIEEQFGWRVAENCPNAIRILDTIDLHCLRIARQKAVKEKRVFIEEDLKDDTAKREIASILRCDLSLMISQVEMELLQRVFKIDASLIQYIPFLLNPLSDTEIQSWLPFESRNHFITIGNFVHKPNWNAVQYLKEEIWPLIRKQLPEAELHVYGSYASQKVNELNDVKQGFLIKGRAKDAMEVVSKAKIVLAPLRFGAGMKGKLIEAMQCGTPSITTTVGAESMHASLEWNGFITNDAKSFADAAVKFYSDKIIWEKAQKNGIKIIQSCFSKDFYGKELLEVLTNLKANLEAHRKHNFTGQILMHHTVSGTKYMAKWIEAKNKIS